MSKETLESYLNTTRKMDRAAARLVLITAGSILLILNIFAYVNHDPFYQVEAPILTGIAALAVIVGFKVFGHKEN
jgi:uncharacterized integral membrane protein